MSQKTTKVKKTTTKTQSDPTVYLVMAAFVLMLLSIAALRWVSHNYVIDATFLPIYSASLRVMVAGLLLALVSAVLWIVLRGNRVARSVCPYVLVLSLLWAVTGYVLRNSWAREMMGLYLLHASVYCLYIVYLLYRAEFFFVSLATVAAGVTFYQYHLGFAANARSITLAVILLAILALTALVAFLAARHKGTLVLGKLSLPLFPKSYYPMLTYITCAIWLVLFLMTLLIGPAFAYYCIFAAVAYELIAAVYYTFQLK